MIIQRTTVKVKDKLETYEEKNYFRVYCMYIMQQFIWILDFQIITIQSM